jgi:hypothetical protein
MNTCPKMQAVIEQLAEKHRVDLAHDDAVLQLDMQGYDTLYIANIGRNCMVVAHYREQPGHIQPDPEVVFFLDNSSGWTPIEVTMVIGGWRAHARLNEDATEIAHVNERNQADLADFVDKMWVLNLQLQEWLEFAELRPQEKRIRRRPPSRLFSLGSVVATPGALEALETAGQTPQELLDRHITGNWGSLPDEDSAQNERALIHGGRIFSAYDLVDGTRMWVITEADRSSTCLLLPREY